MGLTVQGKNMKIAEIDKNFAVKEEKVADGVRWYTIPHPSFSLYGVFFDEKEGFLRMPKAVSSAVSPGVLWGAGCTAGGRVRFSTDSQTFVLKVSYPTLGIMSHMAIEGQGGFILLEETKRGSRLVKMMPPLPSQQNGYSMATALKTDGKMRDYILYFPLYNEVTFLEIALDEKAKVGKGKAYRDVKPILYYGSSITQGGCASRPDNAYQSIISKWNNIDFINLGFSGSAKAEDTMVDYLRGIDCSVFVCDYDHNAPDEAHLERTHYRLYERYRAVQKDTPILFITRPDFKREEARRERIIFETYERARALGDENVYFLAGKTLFGKDKDICTVDGCHPNDLGFYRMAQKIYKKISGMDEKFR